MIKKITMVLAIFLLSYTSHSNTWGGDMINSDLMEYELVYFNKIMRTGRSNYIPEYTEIYYIGKLIVDNVNKKMDFIEGKNVPDFALEVSKKTFLNWQSPDYSLNDNNKNPQYYHFGENEFIGALEWTLKHHSSIRMIDPKVGQKYFKEGKSLSEGDELRQAIIGLSPSKMINGVLVIGEENIKKYEAKDK